MIKNSQGSSTQISYNTVVVARKHHHHLLNFMGRDEAMVWKQKKPGQPHGGSAEDMDGHDGIGLISLRVSDNQTDGQKKKMMDFTTFQKPDFLIGIRLLAAFAALCALFSFFSFFSGAGRLGGDFRWEKDRFSKYCNKVWGCMSRVRFAPFQAILLKIGPSNERMNYFLSIHKQYDKKNRPNKKILQHQTFCAQRNSPHWVTFPRKKNNVKKISQSHETMMVYFFVCQIKIQQKIQYYCKKRPSHSHKMYKKGSLGKTALEGSDSQRLFTGPPGFSGI